MLAYLLIVLGFLIRVIPHAPNMAPVAAIALFSGAYLDKRIAPWVPLAIMILSDMVVGMHNAVPYTWGAFIIIGFMGMGLRGEKKAGGLLAYSAGSAVLFFLITNFGVWLSWYPRTWAGLVDCFVKAVPFFRAALVSNVVFTFVFFGLYELVKKAVKNDKYRELLFVRN